MSGHSGGKGTVVNWEAEIERLRSDVRNLADDTLWCLYGLTTGRLERTWPHIVENNAEWTQVAVLKRGCRR